MTRNVYNSLVALAAVALLATVSLAAEKTATARHSTYNPPAMHYAQATRNAQATTEHKQAVTLAIRGAEDSKSADVLTSALREQGLQAKVEAQKGQPYELTTSISRSMDLSGCGKAVMSAKTAQKAAIPPSFDFVLFAPLTKEKARHALNQLRSLKGVDSQNSHANINKGELWVRINGSARVTPDDVYNAIHSAGIDAHFTKNAGRQS